MVLIMLKCTNFLLVECALIPKFTGFRMSNLTIFILTNFVVATNSEMLEKAPCFKSAVSFIIVGALDLIPLKQLCEHEILVGHY